MHRFTSSIRRPVKRQGAEQYLLITLLSFAASVTFTRMFLELTGYPQLGGGELHIAHVLWGGLLLFLAALLPLLIANRWVYMLGSILAGAGVGLFIDEVGKFITQSNNYFYPLAAPIIYAFFLLVVLLYLRIRRPSNRSPRAELYRAFDSMEEVLEYDLDPKEREELEARLRRIAQQTDQPEFARLANELLEFLSSSELKLAPPRPALWSKFTEWWRPIEARWVTQPRARAFIAGGLLALGLVSLVRMAQALPIGTHPTSLENILTRLILQGLLSSTRGLSWFLARVALETSVGLLLLISAGLLIAQKDRFGVGFAYLGLLLSLTTVDLLVFYFDQFSSIINASVQLGLLLAVTYYRRRFLDSSQPTQPVVPPPDQVSRSIEPDGNRAK